MDNQKKVDLNVEVFDKNEYSKTINPQFTELGVTTITEDLEKQPTVEEFFDLYDILFYTIPERGGESSHEYLIEQSSNYIKFEPIQEEIELLRKEITSLRKELLDQQIKNIELETGQKIDSEDFDQIQKIVDANKPDISSTIDELGTQ